jgi:tryptophan synthase alpha chain
VKRIAQKFQELKLQKRCAFVSYICAGDPNFNTSSSILESLAKSGVDIIELGVSFLDPSGDGSIIENAAKRAIYAGIDLKKTLQMVANFRQKDIKTPLILMSYYNPILKFGLDKIFIEAEKSGVDGILIVDLPLEEEQEILVEISKTKLDLIRLVAPTTSKDRAQKIVKNASGFLYLISLLGITGTKLASVEDNKKNLKMLRQISNLPIVVGFGIKTPKQAEEFSKISVDGVVIGSAIVEEIAKYENSNEIVMQVGKKIQEFAQKINS